MSVYGLDGRVYDGLVYLFTLGSEEPFIQKSMKRLGLKPGDRVLDWGCGTGISLKHIQSHLAEGRVYALDCAPRMAKYAVGRASPSATLDYHFIIRQGTGVELPEKVDATVACYSLCVLDPKDFDGAIEAIWRNTAQDGQLLILETHIDSPKTRWQRTTQFFTRAVLGNVFSDKISGALIPTAERYFERIALDSDPTLNARAFLGRRRPSVSGTEAPLASARH
jgi:ubiquinone/menaquinone biosynthesis C-methylase UbiE